MVLKLFNTLGRKKQEFKPLKDGQVSFYYCGPTVYSQQHIGNLRGAVCADSIRRSLEYLGYSVNFVSNYTDVGHLTSDEDEGEDKIEQGAKKEGLSPADITNKYIKIYEKDTEKLNILPPTTRCRATDYIKPMEEMVATLLKKGFAYQTELAIYFDVSKANNYTQLSGQNLEDLKTGAGTGDVVDPQKKNQNDFVLWFFKTGVHAKALQTWESPWGEACLPARQGFPGWHIECSVMAKKHLGETLDIHMGGIEHIPIHHTNEIAQSESANGVKYVNYWLHNEHLGIDNTKMSKSLGNVVYVNNIEEKGFHPLALRFFFLQAHYRSKQNFTWKAMEAAKNGLTHLDNQRADLGDEVGKISKEFKQKFIEKISDDFNLPQALAIVSEVLKSDLSKADKLATILDFDKVLGLNLKQKRFNLFTKTTKFITKGYDVEMTLNNKISNLLKERDAARKNKDWAESDRIRDEIESQGYTVKDTPDGTQIFNP